MKRLAKRLLDHSAWREVSSREKEVIAMLRRSVSEFNEWRLRYPWEMLALDDEDFQQANPKWSSFYLVLI